MDSNHNYWKNMLKHNICIQLLLSLEIKHKPGLLNKTVYKCIKSSFVLKFPLVEAKQDSTHPTSKTNISLSRGRAKLNASNIHNLYVHIGISRDAQVPSPSPSVLGP